MNGTDTGSSASLVSFQTSSVLLVVTFPSKQSIPCSPTARLGCGLGFPMNQLNFHRIAMSFSPTWDCQTPSVFKRPGSCLLTEALFILVVGQTKNTSGIVYMHNKSTINLQKSWPAWTPQQQFLCLAFLNNFCFSLQENLRSVSYYHFDPCYKRIFNNRKLFAILSQDKKKKPPLFYLSFYFLSMEFLNQTNRYINNQDKMRNYYKKNLELHSNFKYRKSSATEVLLSVQLFFFSPKELLW